MDSPSPDRPWQGLALSDRFLRIPAMLDSEERRYLTWLTAQVYEGWGAVVDLGPWVGGSSACLAEGLRRRGKGGLVHSLDIFSWDRNYMESVLPEDLPEGADFQHVFRRITSGLEDWIAPRKADLHSFRWNEGPIEILFVDAAKTWTLTNGILRGFGASLVPGRTRVVLQDFRFPTCHWLPLIFDSRPDIWQESESVEQGYTVTFTLHKPLTGPCGIHEHYTEEGFPMASAVSLLRSRARKESGEGRRSILKALYRKCMVERDDAEAARVLAELEGTGGPMPPAEKERLDNVGWLILAQGWEAYARDDFATARTRAQVCLTCTDELTEAIVLLGFASVRLGDLATTADCVARLLGTGRHHQGLLLRSELRLREERTSEAVADASEYLCSGLPEPVGIERAIWLLEAAGGGGAGHAAIAERIDRQLLELHEAPWSWVVRARLRVARGRMDEGLTLLREALRRDPGGALAQHYARLWGAPGG